MGHDHNHEHDHSHDHKSSKDNPTDKGFASKPLQNGQTESKFVVSGADCSDEVVAIQKALSDIGINEVSVNLVSSTVTVRHPKSFEIEKLKAGIESTGVKVVKEEDLGFLKENQSRIILIASSGIVLAIGFILESVLKMEGLVLASVFGLSTILSGILVFPKAFRALRSRTLDMNFLMSIAALGAFAISEYSEGATVVFLFSLAELLETFSVSRARQAIKSILKLTPQTVQVRVYQGSIQKLVTDISIGEIVIVRPGDSIPLDGVIAEGETSVNQAPLTGESVPVVKKVGDQVFAGTINEQGGIDVKVEKAFQDTKIARVLKLIEDAQEEKAPSERFVDKFSKIYTPVVFILAIVIAIAPPLLGFQTFDVWFYRALVLLVIACPCALVLATPISVVSGLASLAKQGVLVKGGKYLEALGKIRAVAMDKTGTLTEGKFKVQNFKNYSDKDESFVLKIAVSLEALSSHPLAKAVLEHGNQKKIEPELVKNNKIIAGRGAEGEIGSCLYFVGNHKLTHELGICTPEIEDYLKKLETESLSVIIVAHKPHANHKGEVLGIFGLGDSLKKNAPLAVKNLHAIGIEKVIVLSGDNQKTVDTLAKSAGIDEGFGDLLPEDKVAKIKELRAKYENVAMVGDGVNDAPALANSTVGISMGAMGTDAAIETSDVSLMQDDLAELPKAIHQGRRVLNVIRFNIIFAIATKAVFLILTVLGYSNLWLAVAADMGASIFVTLNALRLLRSHSPKEI